MNEPGQREAEAAVLEAEIAEVCGVVNAATGRLVSLIARAIETGSWEGWGIRSAAHWVGWKCGVSPNRAAQLVAMATRITELPATMAALEAGEVSVDQAAVVCRHVPAAHDVEAAALAQVATVSQLRRSLGRYSFGDEPAAKEGDEPAPTKPDGDGEVRRTSFGTTEAGRWSLSAELPVDEGALVERALTEARQALFLARHGDSDDEALRPSPSDVSWADALVAMAERSLMATSAGRPARDRHMVLIHLKAEGQAHRPGGPGLAANTPDGQAEPAATYMSHLHGGPGLPASLRRLLSCDASGRLVLHDGGRPLSVGRAQRIVPDRTRTMVEDRDGGCRVPGCSRQRWLQVHHIVHWEDGGATDTANLVALCGDHHRLHHRNRLGIEGDADVDGGLVFTDHLGRRLEACGRPTPPGAPPVEAARRLDIPTGRWRHPSGEPMSEKWLYFNVPKAAG